MPFLDVSDILSDPDFVDASLYYHRNKQVTDDDGFSINISEEIRFYGVVTVDRSLEARRMEAGQAISGAILIVTNCRLTQGDEQHDADVVIYQGRQYRVTVVDPYTAYGAGFIQAHCELVDFNGGQPVE